MGKDWVGDKNSVFRTLGASNHSDGERDVNDYYATEPKAVELLMDLESFDKNILEPSCGEGHISDVLKSHGYNVVSRDLVNRGYGSVADFLSKDNTEWNGDIITNPPYKYAQEFVEKALQIIPDGHKVAMFLKVQYLEGKRRRKLFDTMPPKRIWVSSSRLKCAINGDFDKISGSATSYAWFVWEKGFRGDTIIKWFN
nr:MAG TPA: adenine-specific methyltransferase [Caudoviricetes sp.]DAX76154.1 MAG TPA: adenine-specific methyltransferase [Caudoviricetes sp.]